MKDNTKRTIYKRDEEAPILEALDELHNKAEHDPDLGSIINRAYMVVSITSFENGVAVGAGTFGDEPMHMSGNILKDAKTVVDAGAHSIVANTMMKSITDTDWAEERVAEGEAVIKGASSVLEDAGNILDKLKGEFVA